MILLSLDSLCLLVLLSVNAYSSHAYSSPTQHGEGTLKFRLAGSINSTIGRVEVLYDSIWGTVCDDMWDANDAKVVCSQLGLPHGSPVALGNAYFGEGAGPIWMDDISCSGSETSLQDCQHGGWGDSNCEHHEDAGVICTETPIPIRLVGGSDSTQGRVEVFIDNIWGTMCGDREDAYGAKATCRQLGLPHGSPVAVRNAYFGEGSGPIWATYITCTGAHSLADCQHIVWRVSNCGHHQDVGVICTDSAAQFSLVGGSSSTEGRIEVLLNDNIWGTVCGDSWDVKDAKILCRQLSLPHGSPVALGNAYFGEGSRPIWMNDVKCSGFETSLQDCQHSGWGDKNCDHPDAGVICTDTPIPIRLVGGSDSTQGRVEVFIDNIWGTVCGKSWDVNDAKVLCRQLGHPHGSPVALRNAYFGKGSGPIWMDDVRCFGFEKRLQDCRYSGCGDRNSEHDDDAGVICTDKVSEMTIFSKPVVLNMADVEVELCLYDFILYDGELSHSCQDRCGMVYPYDCKCDVLCEVYGDCCIDYAIVCRLQPGVNQTRSNNRSRSISTMIKLHAYQEIVISWGWMAPYGRCISPTNYSNFVYFLVNRCPDDSSPYLKEACANSSHGDPISFIPVSVDNIDYQNKFCAICWGKNEESFEVWDLEFNTCIPQYLNKNLNEVHTFTNCTSNDFNYHRRSDEAVSPRCSQDMIQTCPDGAKSPLVEACTSYMATILVGDAYFKNPHCAVCNLADMGHNLGCMRKTTLSDKYVPKYEAPPDFRNENLPKPTVNQDVLTHQAKKPVDDAKMSDLFNLWSNKDDCAEDEIFDFYHWVCRQITCLDNSRLNGETCISVYDQGGILENDTFVRLEFQVYTDVTTTLKDFMEAVPVSVLQRYMILKSDKIQVIIQEMKASPSSRVGIFDNNCLGDDVAIVTLKSTGFLLNISFDELIQRLSNDILNQCISVHHTVVIVRFMTLSNFPNVPMLEQNCSGDNQQLTLNVSSETFIANVNGTNVVNPTTDQWIIRSSTSSTPQIVTVHPNYTQTRESFICHTTLTSCAYITLKSMEYEWVGETEDTLLYIASGRQIPREEVIVLEDNTVKICSNEFRMKHFQYTKGQTIINIIGCSLSIVALFVTILTYFMFSELRNIPGKTILSLSLAMICGQLLLLFDELDIQDVYPLCLSVAMMIHFAWIAVFAWTNIFAFDLARTFGTHSSNRHMNSSLTFKRYSAYGWGLPLVTVCATVIVHFVVPIGGRTESLYDLVTICWLTGMPLLVVFCVPVALLLLGNIVFLACTSIGIRHTRRATSILEKEGETLKKMKEDLFRTFKLSIVIGLTWIIGFIIPFTGVPNLWYVFLVLNSMQGPVIMWSFVCNNRVSAMWKTRLRRALGMPENVKGSTSTKTSKTSSSAKCTSIQMQTSGIGDKASSPLKPEASTAV